MISWYGVEVVARPPVANGINIFIGITGVQLDPIFAGHHEVQAKIHIKHDRQ